MPKPQTATTQATLPPQELVVNPPNAVSVAAPDTVALVEKYNTVILPLWRRYQGQKITSAEDYVQWNRDWDVFKSFSSDIEKLFESPCKEAYDAHRALTGMRAYIQSFPNQGAKIVGDEVLRYQAEQERIRIENERAEQARQAAEHARQVREAEAAAEAERQRQLAKRQAAIESIPEWELDESTIPPVPEVAVVALAPAPPPVVRLPSTVPIVFGGPRVADKPWAARITDPVALLKWVLESPEERIAQYVSFNMPELNKKCREHEKRVTSVIPGIEAVREQILKRG